MHREMPTKKKERARAVSCTAFVPSPMTGGASNINWPLSPIGAVSRAAFEVSCRTGGPSDISGLLMSTGAVSCIAFEERMQRRGCGREEAEEEEKSNIIMFMIS